MPLLLVLMGGMPHPRTPMFEEETGSCLFLFQPPCLFPPQCCYAAHWVERLSVCCLFLLVCHQLNTISSLTKTFTKSGTQNMYDDVMKGKMYVLCDDDDMRATKQDKNARYNNNMRKCAQHVVMSYGVRKRNTMMRLRVFSFIFRPSFLPFKWDGWWMIWRSCQRTHDESAVKRHTKMKEVRAAKSAACARVARTVIHRHRRVRHEKWCNQNAAWVRRCPRGGKKMKDARVQKKERVRVRRWRWRKRRKTVP